MAEIQFTGRARAQLKHIFRYVHEEFGNAALIRLENALLRKLEIISRTPSAFPKYVESTETRRVVVNSKTLLYYRFEGSMVYITAVKSSYQNYSPEDFS